MQISNNEYDELGQLKKKEIGQKRDENGYINEALETQEYTYNIRGWLQGINKAYARGSSQGTAPWFGMELNYDWGFDLKNFNGNISGTRWRSRGDGEQLQSNTEFKTYVLIDDPFRGQGQLAIEAPMPKIIPSKSGAPTTDPVYQKYDHNIAAETLIFNLWKNFGVLPAHSNGKNIDDPSTVPDLDPTLV